MKYLFPVLAAALIAVFPGCFLSEDSPISPEPVPEVPATVINLDSPTGGFTTADEAPAFGEPEAYAALSIEAPVLDPIVNTYEYQTRAPRRRRPDLGAPRRLGRPVRYRRLHANRTVPARLVRNAPSLGRPRVHAENDRLRARRFSLPHRPIDDRLRLADGSARRRHTREARAAAGSSGGQRELRQDGAAARAHDGALQPDLHDRRARRAEPHRARRPMRQRHIDRERPGPSAVPAWPALRRVEASAGRQRRGAGFERHRVRQLQGCLGGRAAGSPATCAASSE